MAMKCKVTNPYDKINKNLKHEDRIQLGPGPSNSSKSVMDALNIQPITFSNKYYYQFGCGTYIYPNMATKCKVTNPYDKINKNLKHEYRIQLGGSSNSSKSVMDALNIQPITFSNEHYYQLKDDVQEMVRYLYQTKNPLTVVQQTSGNGGNEAMVTNLADPGDTIVVAIQGVWGAKVADMGKRYNLNVIELRLPPGEVFTFEHLEDEIIKNKAVALFVTHGESTGGTLQPLEGLGEICHRHNCLLAVDAVVTVGVVPILVDEWQIDAINGGSQKGLGAPIGMTLLSFIPKAHERMLSKKSKPPYIYDMLLSSAVWNCFGKPRGLCGVTSQINKKDMTSPQLNFKQYLEGKYQISMGLPISFSFAEMYMDDFEKSFFNYNNDLQNIGYIYSYGMHMINAIREALINICREGLENVWERHRQASELFLDKIGRLGMKHFIEKPENRFYGVSMVVVPEGVNIYSLLNYISKKYLMEFGLGVGPTGGGKILRVGFLCNSARTDIVEKFVEALEDGIKYCLENPTDAKTLY